MIDILIENGTIVTMNKVRETVQNGAIAIEKSKIVGVGKTKDVEREFRARKVIDANNTVVMPGLIDCHHHSGHGLIKAIGEHGFDWNKWVGEAYPRCTTESFWYVESLLSAIEKIKFGTTCAATFFGGGMGGVHCDDPIYSDNHLKAATEVGIREVFGIGPAGQSLPVHPRTFSHWQGNKSIEIEIGFEAMLSVIERVIKKWNDADDGRIQVAISPNRLVASSEPPEQDMLVVKKQAAQLRELTAKYGTGIMAHASGGTIHLLKELQMLGKDTMLSHCTGLSDEEIKTLAATETPIVHCAKSSAVYQARCPVVELIEAGGIVVLGSDGNAPNLNLDLFEVMRRAASLQRLHFKSSDYMPPGKLLEMVTIDAAKALRLDHLLGSIEVGKKADIILLDMHKPHLVPEWLAPQKIVYYASGSDVDTVLIDGRIVMQNRKMTRVDESKVLKDAQREGDKFLERLDLTPTLVKPSMDFSTGFWGTAKY